MTDNQLAAGVLKAVQQAVGIFTKRPPRSHTELRELVIGAYLSGASQTANFLTRNEGALTSQQIERALGIAADQLGIQQHDPRELQ